ncbi:four-carbon acid sugar kinase family protein [Olivibacter sp. SDN3]|uniref:four-carbon acid sugar kinase family protein n=1 Tax=Olivibacter sp. SDN3 TaxID=2764720 RepID=UPI0016510FC8|nr:four-carbon acid sugar kinase family protein [Olivibacter sp. SDN3]QNL48395.1 four-carbon acid sugar kinase family protein [Olivibacter sp. SDN3]
MIVVIADDLTGAAEIGGIGIRFNLAVTMVNGVCTDRDITTDLLVINTDTRSLPRQEAMVVISSVLDWVAKLPYSYLYKKVDSVLRGYVKDELMLLSERFTYRRIILIPANPLLGRVVKKGCYFVNDKLIHETAFAMDPEFPTKTSDVLEMLGNSHTFVVKNQGEPLPDKGEIVGEVSDVDDLILWVDKIEEGTLAAGSSAFFEALLRLILQREPTVPMAKVDLLYPQLFVCGSSFPDSIKQVKMWHKHHKSVFFLPSNTSNITKQYQSMMEWAISPIFSLFQQKKAIIAFESDQPINLKNNAVMLRNLMAEAVTLVLNESPVKELFIEGGATAAAILKALGITQLYPKNELAPGVVRCAAIGKRKLWITMKPGSYDWQSVL